jgi:ubiquinone/menaquinone biosynthesis C-methylase UbiE
MIRPRGASVLTPARRRGSEILDDPMVDPALRLRSMADVARSNRWLGGLRAAAAELRDVLRTFPRGSRVTLVDVGTGTADIPAQASRTARALGLQLETIGVDGAASVLGEAKQCTSCVVCASALALPFPDHSVDVVLCSQLLHHFADEDAERLVRELDRVARRAVIVSDLRRSWVAAIGFWLVSFPLGFHRVTRHDGCVSVMRGFTAGELHRLVYRAVSASPSITHRLGYRIAARWAPLAS